MCMEISKVSKDAHKSMSVDVPLKETGQCEIWRIDKGRPDIKVRPVESLGHRDIKTPLLLHEKI